MDRRQILHEIEWLKNKLKEVKKPKHRRDLERQIKERELNLDHGIDRKPPLNPQTEMT